MLAQKYYERPLVLLGNAAFCKLFVHAPDFVAVE